MSLGHVGVQPPGDIGAVFAERRELADYVRAADRGVLNVAYALGVMAVISGLLALFGMRPHFRLSRR